MSIRIQPRCPSCREFTAIHSALTAILGDTGVDLRETGRATTLSGLKRCEDALDALVCAWVGAEFLAGRTTGLGDDTAAIWCPSDVIHGRT